MYTEDLYRVICFKIVFVRNEHVYGLTGWVINSEIWKICMGLEGQEQAIQALRGGGGMVMRPCAHMARSHIPDCFRHTGGVVIRSVTQLLWAVTSGRWSIP